MLTRLLTFLKQPYYIAADSLHFNLLYALLTIILYDGVFFKHATAYNNGFCFLGGLFICLWLIWFIAAEILFHRYTRKPLAIFFILLNTTAFYFMFTYNATIDKIMFLNILQTDVSEVRDLLRPRFFWFMLVLGILPAAMILKTRILPSSRRRHMAAISIAAGIIALIMLGNFSTTDSFLRSNRNLRYYLAPSNYIGSLISIAKLKARPMQNLVKIGEDATLAPYWHGKKKNLFVFVMGETARAANFSLRGYHRPTNEALTAYLQDLIYYKDTQACGTSTAVSVPCIFSHNDRQNFKPGTETHTENLLDILQRAGYKVLWRENNTGCQNVCNRVELEDPCKTGKFCLDEILLDNLENKAANFTSDAFVVLHQRGSHGPAYSEHYSQEADIYKPICTQKDFPECSKESLVNVYDNTIAYTSQFLAKTIDKLSKLSDKYNTVMIYISDHGESLGENGMLLHSAPYKTAPAEQKDIPFLIWISDSFAKDFNLDKDCLRRMAENPHSQDNIFHSVLGLSGVKTGLYIPTLDIFAACRNR